MKRRDFLKAIVAAPIAVQAIGWDQIFVKDDGKPIGSTNLPNGYTLGRHAVSLGMPPAPMQTVEAAKKLIIQWVLDRKLGKYAKQFRFTWQLMDHDTDLGIGIAVYNTVRNDVGMTWGQMIREMKIKGLIT